MKEVDRMEVQTMLRRLGRPLPQPLKMKLKRSVFRTSVRSTDVFLVGHPKSGNTWLAYMLAVVLRRGDRGSRVTMATVGDTVPTIHGDESKVASFRTLPNPRVFRNESPTFPELYPRTVYLVRDPRTTLVSYYHHYRAISGDDGTEIDTFIQGYLRDGHFGGYHARLQRWDIQATEWMRRAVRQPVLIARYEDLHEDRRAVLDKVASFCGIPFAGDMIDTAAVRGDFDEMRRDEDRHGAEAFPWVPGAGPRFLRSGRVDGWRDELSERAVTAIERELGPAMQQLGYALVATE